MGWTFRVSCNKAVTGACNEHHQKIWYRKNNGPYAADWGASDPLSVPLVAREMRKASFSTNEIERVTFYNAYEFFKQSSRFTWKP